MEILIRAFDHFRRAKNISSKLSLIPFLFLTLFFYPFQSILKFKYHELRFLGIFSDLILQNRDGVFYCRKKTEDVELINPSYEGELRKFFDLKRGIFVDVGAHIGKYTIMVGNKIDGKVISTEPGPSNFKILMKNIKLNFLKNVTPFNLALSNKNGKRKLFVSKILKGCSTFYPTLKIKYQKEREVETKRCDEILDLLNISKIDLMKIDAECAEKEILEGMGDYLKKTEKIIYEEWEDERETSSFLKKANFKIINIDNSSCKIAINKNFKIN